MAVSVCTCEIFLIGCLSLKIKSEEQEGGTKTLLYPRPVL